MSSRIWIKPLLHFFLKMATTNFALAFLGGLPGKMSGSSIGLWRLIMVSTMHICSMGASPFSRHIDYPWPTWW